MVRMQKQAERFGARVKTLEVVEAVDLSQRPFVLTVDGERVETQSRDHRHRRQPSPPGAAERGVVGEKGVTFCATCDGAWAVFRNQPLVVVGGGDSACEEALYLTRFASEVILIHRRDTLRASKIMAQRVLSHEKIKPIWDTEVAEILDCKLDKVTGVRLKNLKTGAESVLPCAGVFVAIGHVPNTQLFKGVLDMDENGYIIPREGTATNIPGVFVAGDCADHVYRQAVTAAGSRGCAAAIDAERFLALRKGKISGVVGPRVAGQTKISLACR